MQHYTYDDIRSALLNLNIERGDTLLIRADLRYLGMYSDGVSNLTKDLFAIFSDLVDLSEGTIVVPTGCLSLCNTTIPYHPEKTPSELGVFSEFVRHIPGAIRSFHPFFSYTAIGKKAHEICADHPRSAFGLNTPKDKLISMGAKAISIGASPRFTCTTVHHAEFMVGVPYRYVKEFIHPVYRNGEILNEPFYLYVMYRTSDMKRNNNVKLWATFPGWLATAPLGAAHVYSYSIKEFYQHCVKKMQEDFFIYLDEEPDVKPYRV